MVVPSLIRGHLFSPNIGFTNTKHIEKQANSGTSDIAYFWMQSPHHLEFFETQVVTSYCKFDFKSFPFDSHECELLVINNVFSTGRAIFSDTEVVYMDSKTNKKSEKFLPFDVRTEVIFPYDAAFMGYNYSRTGIKIHFKRNSLSLLKGKFYGPTAIFSLLSMLSYTIAIEKVTSNELDNQKNSFTYI